MKKCPYCGRFPGEGPVCICCKAQLPPEQEPVKEKPKGKAEKASTAKGDK